MTLRVPAQPALGHMAKCGGEPQARRWVLVDGSPALCVGNVRPSTAVSMLHSGAPTIAELMVNGTITRIVTETHAIWVWLADGLQWYEWAAPVDTALRNARISHASSHEKSAEFELVVESTPETTDEVLRLVARDVIDGQLADFIASHGGEVAIGDVRNGTVSVTFGGACGHCPLSDVTLHLRIEGALRERFPDLDEVRDVTARAKPGLFAGLFQGRAREPR